MGLSIDEQETIIRIGRTEDVAEICTSDTRYMTKLDRLCKENPETWKFIRQETCDGDPVEKFYECPTKLISFRSRNITREMSDEQRKAAADRLRIAREKKK